MVKKSFLITIILSIFLLTTMQLFAADGFISKWVNGKESGLAGATIIVGKNIDLKTGNTGTDKVTGTISGTAVTDDSGNFTIDVPPGAYTVIVWKGGYTPQVDKNVNIEGYSASLGKSESSSLHQDLSY